MVPILRMNNVRLGEAKTENLFPRWRSILFFLDPTAFAVGYLVVAPLALEIRGRAFRSAVRQTRNEHAGEGACAPS
jgi:hypothetical protein